MKRSRMKPGRRKPRPSLDEFARQVLEGQMCAICGERPATDPHHHLPKAKLKALPAAYVDARNGCPLCAGCHAQVTNGRVECPEPPGFRDFLNNHGLLESGRPDPLRRTA